ncbi:MAG: DUF2071 domain-containing protein [Planctomycetota bacterium]
MRIPTITGVIDRRILANYRIDPQCMADALPRPFRPYLFQGYAIGGICLIRLKKIRPKFLPVPWGLSSENAAHRVAVEWDDQGTTRRGVCIPRRDTNSRLNSFVGGTLFPGVHHFARFESTEENDKYFFKMKSRDGDASVEVSGAVAEKLSPNSIFGTLENASRFFEDGSLGYSDSNIPGQYDGLELECHRWAMEPLRVDSIQSSYFENESLFPIGSVHFDSRLLMRDIAH